MLSSADVQRHLGRRRWASLAVLCAAVIVIVMDGSIVNVALPTLAVKLAGATNSRLQWIVDSYILAFAALLLTSGVASDRFGRRRVLLLGLVVFGAVSIGAATSGSCDTLIAWRALMGVGAAMIFPSTLALITEDFPEPGLRKVAIAIWAGTSGLGVAIGPITGGWLLEHWHWGSVFLVNLPVVAAAVVGVFAWCLESRDRSAPPFDPMGCVLAILTVLLLVWGLIEAPELGWGSSGTILALAGSALSFGLFVAWERKTDRPMLDLGRLSNRPFAGACIALATAFFGLFGFVFMVTQFFQFLLEYGALKAGIRTAPFAGFILLGALGAAGMGKRAPARAVFVAGLALMAGAFAWATRDDMQTIYGVMVCQMGLLGVGLGIVNAAATEVIMSSLPADKAGTGSSVNDTLREVGGMLGVAAMGSAFNAMYRSRINESLAGVPMPPEAKELVRASVGAAHGVITRVGEMAGAGVAEAIRAPVNRAFLEGFRASCWIACGCAAVGAAIAFWVLRPRAANNAAESLQPVE